VHTYTVNDVQKMLCLTDWEIDGFFCDDFPLAQKTLASISY